ncbi:MAG TPA: hypothetical protein VFK02_02935 [Kofleriaceae bacterium]|nr:hypothetical protein [Kofleriaceae bacterium]
MTTQSVTIRLPDPIYQQLKRQADRARRSTEAEMQEAATLLRQDERVMLVRAHAAALLKERGHDVSGLLTAA